MTPGMKWAGDLLVGEQAIALESGVLGDPDFGKRTEAETYDEARTGFESAGTFEHFRLLPGWGEHLKSVGTFVEREDGFGGRGDPG